MKPFIFLAMVVLSAGCSGVGLEWGGPMSAAHIPEENLGDPGSGSRPITESAAVGLFPGPTFSFTDRDREVLREWAHATGLQHERVLSELRRDDPPPPRFPCEPFRGLRSSESSSSVHVVAGNSR